MTSRSFLCLALFCTSALAGSNDGSRVLQSYFDVDAPSIAFEDVDEYNNRIGNDSERRRNESLSASKACMDNKRAPGQVSAGPASNAPVTSIRPDLRDKSLHELALMYQKSPDPDIATAIQIRAAEASPNAGMPVRQGSNRGTSPEARLLDQLGRSAGATDAVTQDCLASAEAKAEGGEQPLHGAFDEAAAFLRKGRARSVVVDLYGAMPGEAYLGVLRRYNVVSRSGPYTTKVLSIKEADKQSLHPQGIYWPNLPDKPNVAADSTAQPQKKTAPSDGFRALKDLLKKPTEGSK